VRPGNGSYALISEEGLTGSTGFAVLRPRDPQHREIVYLAATSRDTIDALSHLADGAAYPAVRPDIVAARQVMVPDDECLTAFSDTVSPLIDRIEGNKAENQTLAKLRDLLLPNLISGEVRLKDAENNVGEIL
jgi:type I restriction enzyme S subunit